MDSKEEKRKYWKERIVGWEKSGQNKAAFCRVHRLPVWQFYYWYRRLSEAEEPTGFARVYSESRDSGLRLHFTTGLEMTLDRDFDEITLKRFLSVASSSC